MTDPPDPPPTSADPARDDASGARATEPHFGALVRDTHDCFVVTDEAAVVRYVSPALTRILGFEPEAAVGKELHEGLDDTHRDRLVDAFDDVRRNPGTTRRVELRVPHADGGHRWIETLLSNHLDDPDLHGMVATFRDITERRATLQALRERTAQMELFEQENRQLLAIFDITSDLAILTDPMGRLKYLNAAARAFFGVEGPTLDAAMGRPWREWVGATDSDEIDRVTRIGEDGRWTGEVTLRRHDGQRVPVMLQLHAHQDPSTGEVDFFSAMAHDISNRKLLETSLELQATHDELTGLPNRALLFERVGRAIDGLRNPSSTGSVALLFIDIDHFKSINDNLGHTLGDRILERVAERIRDAVRPGDTVARFGGDEFVVLCERLVAREDAVMIADRLESSLEDPLHIEGRQVGLGVSIGISYADPDDPDPISVIRDADAAMYLAKAGGRGRWVIFDDELRERAGERRRTETSMRATLEGQELELHYQPVVSLATDELVGVEALLRWRRDGELVAPDEFVPLAEETGLIVPIGTWVMRTACSQLAAWQARPGCSSLRLAVNVSARQLQDRNFASLASAAAFEPGLAPGTLAIEITESVLLDDVEASVRRLEQLKELGIGISLDDFGTGYSSLTYLRRFPVDTVKLDRSFVDGVGSDEGDTAIVTAVIELAAALGLDSVAEGVETEEQRDALRALGCDYAQGYWYSPGLPADTFAERYLSVPLSPSGGRHPATPPG